MVEFYYHQSLSIKYQVQIIAVNSIMKFNLLTC